MDETMNFNDANWHSPDQCASTHGEGLRRFVETRQHELDTLLAHAQIGPEPGPGTHASIDTVLGTLNSFLTGDLDHIPDGFAIAIGNDYGDIKFGETETALR